MEYVKQGRLESTALKESPTGHSDQKYKAAKRLPVVACTRDLERLRLG